MFLAGKAFRSFVARVAVLSLLCGAVSLGEAREARAIDRDVKAVITAGGYGLLGGTLLGLASFPFTRNSRSIFVGTSVGLYLGIAVGLYYISNRDDPGNPLRPQEGDRYRWREEQDERDDDPEYDTRSGIPPARRLGQPRDPLVYARVEIARF